MTQLHLSDHRGVLIVVLAILVVVTLLARRTVGHPVLSRLRAVLPAWRFFDRAAPSPYLLIRWAAPGAAFGTWSPITGGSRGAACWAFAPQANLFLVCQAAIEQLVAELADVDCGEPVTPDAPDTDPAITDRVSYDVVSRIARAYLPVTVRNLSGVIYQWKLVVPGTTDQADSLVSVELAA